MYYNDHAPPHFHASLAEFEAVVRIDDGEVVKGDLPARALSMVREWLALHRSELLGNWDKARSQLPLDTIDPLP